MSTCNLHSLFGYISEPFRTTALRSSFDISRFFSDRDSELTLLEANLIGPSGGAVLIVGDRGVGTTSLVHAWISRHGSNRLIVNHELVGRENLNVPTQLLKATIDLYEQAGRLGRLRFWQLRRTLLKLRQNSILFAQKVVKKKRTVTGKGLLTALGISSAAAAPIYALLGQPLIACLPILFLLAYASASSWQVESKIILNPESKQLIAKLITKLCEKVMARNDINGIVVIFDFGDWSGDITILGSWIDDMTFYVRSTSISFVFVLNRDQYSQLNRGTLLATVRGEIRLRKFTIDQFRDLIQKGVTAVTPSGGQARNPFDGEITDLIYFESQGHTFKMIGKCKNLLAICAVRRTDRICPNWVRNA